MEFGDLFSEYYALFRQTNQIPTSTNIEWALAVYSGNAGIRRWANVDGEDWDVLWGMASAQGFSETWPGNTSNPVLYSFSCPSNMKKPGGFIVMTDPVSQTYIRFSVVALQDVQFQNESAPYAYFTGGEQEGFTLYINFSGSSNYGWIIDFPMYRTPTYFNATSTGDGSGNVVEDGLTVTEVPDSSFLINFMMARRLFGTRNPFYQQCLKDSEIALKGMQIKNGTGQAGNTWNLNDQNKTGNFGPNNTPAVTNSGFGF